MIIFIKTI